MFFLDGGKNFLTSNGNDPATCYRSLAIMSRVESLKSADMVVLNWERYGKKSEQRSSAGELGLLSTMINWKILFFNQTEASSKVGESTPRIRPNFSLEGSPDFAVLSQCVNSNCLI